MNRHAKCRILVLVLVFAVSSAFSPADFPTDRCVLCKDDTRVLSRRESVGTTDCLWEANTDVSDWDWYGVCVQSIEEKWCLRSDVVVHAPRKFAGHSVLLDLSDIRASEWWRGVFVRGVEVKTLLYSYTHAPAFTHTHTHAHTHHTNTHQCIHAQTSALTCIHARTYLHTSTHIHTHTRTHTLTQAHTHTDVYTTLTRILAAQIPKVARRRSIECGSRWNISLPSRWRW